MRTLSNVLPIYRLIALSANNLRAYPQTPPTLLLPSLKHSSYVEYASYFPSVAPRI